MPASFVRWFKDIGLGEVPPVGGKNASLGELYRELGGAGVRVPNGFAITADGYRHFMQASGLAAKVAALLHGLQVANLADLAERGLAIRHAMTAADLPADLQDAIVSAYERLGEGEPVDVAVRSSATAEDLPDASFAGQQETYLNVRGRAALGLRDRGPLQPHAWHGDADGYRVGKGRADRRVVRSEGPP